MSTNHLDGHTSAEAPQPFFPHDTYSTPPGRERKLHRLLLRSRIYYIIGFLRVILRYRKKALHDCINTARSLAAMDCFHLMESCGGIFRIAGLNNPRSVGGPVVFIANHMSTMETLILPTLVFPDKNTVFVIKQQLRDVPLFGAYVQDCIAVTRKNPTDDFKQVITQGVEKLAQGFSVIIFPQATRSAVFDPEKFNTLGIKLARRAGVPVIPVALKTDFWGTGTLIKDFGPINSGRTIYVECGEPITVSGSGKNEHEQVVAFIKKRLLGWGGQSH